jgi:hypothetical protein
MPTAASKIFPSFDFRDNFKEDLYMEENLEQSVQNPISPQKKFNLRSPKLIIIFLLVILLCVAVLAAMFYFGKVQKTTVINQEENLVIPIKPTSLTGKIAYRNGGGWLKTGDIWISKADGTEKKQLTKSKNIYSLLSWSPDNNYILAIKDNSNGEYVVISATSGAALSMPVSNTFNISFGPEWINNREFILVASNKLLKVDINGKITEIVTLPTNLESPNPTPNKEMDFIAYDTNLPSDVEHAINVYTYNLLTKQKYQITQYDKVHPYSFDGWYKNMVLYDNGIDYWLSTPDGKNKTQINLEGWKILGISFASNSKIYVSAASNDTKHSPSRMVFSYEYPNTFKELYSPLNLPHGNLSRDGRFLTTQEDGENSVSAIVDLESGATQELCKSSCYYPVWQN